LKSEPYWLNTQPVRGSDEPPPISGEIAVIGSGLAGASTAYWLSQYGFRNLVMLDHELPKAASFRNCGHVLHGTVESMKALVALHGEETARELWGFSVEICQDITDTVARLNIDADYRQDGYLVIAIDEAEDREIRESIDLLHQFGFASDYLPPDDVRRRGFRNTYGARYEPGCAQIHPTKFRNQLVTAAMEQGTRYHSGVQVKAVDESSGTVRIQTADHGELHFDAAVIATNAYSPLLSSFFAAHRLIEPFRGQIITSQPLQTEFPTTFPHSFDHGYEYGLITTDRRLMLGGWRQHSANQETGTYDLTPNPAIEQGLAEFARRYYDIDEPLEWNYSWSGIMASSATGLPFIGPTDSSQIFTVSGFTGHGVSWAHGSAKLLAKIMAGETIPPIARQFSPLAHHRHR
jgi:glycine/D-amino acid oxidase-like deaminating enzyme